MALSNVVLCFILISAMCAANAQWPIPPYGQQYYHLQSLNRAVEAAKAMYETLAEEQTRAQHYYFGYHADANKQQEFITNKEQFEQGPFPPPVSKQGGGLVTDQQALEAEGDPNQPNRLYPQFGPGLAPGGPG